MSGTHATSAVRPRAGLWFGKPVAAGKVPRKVNVFESMVGHQGMLEQIPLFPYVGPGDIVPTAALSLSSPSLPRLHFYHYNDVPEVVIAMAGQNAMLVAGQIYLQQGTHGVNTFLRKADAPEAYAWQISLIIIRMKQEGPQNEAFILRCDKCNEVVFRTDRDVFEGRAQAWYPELANVRFYADAADLFNSVERACPACNAVQPRFPTELVGWRRYAQYVELANRARSDIEAAARGR
jgi:hypothetical protein